MVQLRPWTPTREPAQGTDRRNGVNFPRLPWVVAEGVFVGSARGSSSWSTWTRIAKTHDWRKMPQNGASVHSLPQVNASVQPVVCVGYNSVMVKHVSNSGATVKPTITAYTHIVVLGTIMNCFQSKLEIKMQLMRSPANGKPSPEQRLIQKYFCPLLRIRIKPQQPRHLMMSRTCLDVRRHSAWKRS